MAKPSESIPRTLEGRPGPRIGQEVQRSGSSVAAAPADPGRCARDGLDPKLCCPQGRVRGWEDRRGGGGDGATDTVGAARGAAGPGREEGRPGAPGRGTEGSRGGREGWAGRGGGRESPAPPGGVGPGARSEPAAATRTYLCQKDPAWDAGRRGSLMPANPLCRRRPPASGRSSTAGSGEWAGGAGAGGARRGSSGCYG